MAAALDARVPEIVELRHLSVTEIEPLLAEEAITWRSLLSWDFTPSAELVRRFVRIQALNGHALVRGDQVIGYSYHVCEERKALIGDLYVLKEYASTHHEDLLLGAALNALARTPHLQRIEAQLMMSRGPFDRPLPFGRFAQVYPRNFMVADLNETSGLPAGAGAREFRFEPWDERREEEAAQVIASCYNGHIDSSINDQYRSVMGARRFLLNIVQYPGCGAFYAPGSYMVITADGRLRGVCLASMVASDAGHITQICVTPDLQGRGAGYELLRRSLAVMGEHGCEKVSLTVTASNEQAIRLYQMMGFRAMRRFAAYVWEGF